MRTNTVLIVDDNAAMRKALCRLFKAAGGFSVCGEASNGTEAVTMSKALRPQVVVLDLNMPGSNGLETARELRELAPAPHIILYSMNAEDLREEEALRAGVAAVVSKTQGMKTFIKKARMVVSRLPDQDSGSSIPKST